ncbi:SpoIIIAH-like family protein [Terrilactibacillus sp. S3-3]|nr:SpoIIIAH-like family protein [Terrilactibacillus sp. S3-3]
MSKLEKKYQGIITSEKSSTEEVSKAYDSLEALKTLANNEKMLEDVIKSKGFADAVVQASGHEVQVFISSDKLSNKQANTIMKLANEYLGSDKMVSVDYALTEK